MKSFIRYYKPYKVILILDLLCAAIISLVDLAFPQVLKKLVSTLYREEGSVILKELPVIALVFFSAYLLQTFCKYFVTYKGHEMGAQMERDMRRELFDHYEALSFSYYDRNNTGQMMSKLISDLFDISEMAHHAPENLFISLIKVVGAFLFLFRIQAGLAMILLAVVLLMLVAGAVQNRAMHATFADNRRKIGDVNASLQDSLSGIRVVQAFCNEEVERAKFRRGNEAFLDSKRANYRAFGRFHSTNGFFIGMMYLSTVVFGGYFVAKGQMKADDLAMFALYIGVFVSPIQILVELTEMIQKGYSGFSRFLDVVSVVPEIVDAPDAEPFRDPEGEIEFRNVCFSYEENETVLENVSFRIAPGESAALVGPSGGGKTTICSLIPRFYDLTGGEILIGGQDIRKIRLRELRGAIGVVQQEVYLFSGTIRENIAYGRPWATEEEIMAAAEKADLQEFVDLLPDGYDTFVGERGTRLSGGQKQRISIARIFLKDPKILILDEATSALDNESERYIQKSLEELSRDRTTITIAHRLSTIRDADEILVIDGSGISERGTHEELTALNGTYANYYRLSSGEA